MKSKAKMINVRRYASLTCRPLKLLLGERCQSVCGMSLFNEHSKIFRIVSQIINSYWARLGPPSGHCTAKRSGGASQGATEIR